MEDYQFVTLIPVSTLTLLRTFLGTMLCAQFLENSLKGCYPDYRTAVGSILSSDAQGTRNNLFSRLPWNKFPRDTKHVLQGGFCFWSLPIMASWLVNTQTSGMLAKFLVLEFILTIQAEVQHFNGFNHIRTSDSISFTHVFPAYQRSPLNSYRISLCYGPTKRGKYFAMVNALHT